MVVFGLIFRNENKIRYEYFPEGDKNSTAGIIGIDCKAASFEVIQPAEREISLSIDNKADVTVPSERMHLLYAGYAILKIKAAYANGIVLEGGTAVWK